MSRSTGKALFAFPSKDVKRFNLDKFTDNTSDGSAAHTDPQDSTEQLTGESQKLADQSRRRFSRGALAGGAVLLSLGNRAAWGGGSPTVVDCMSVMTLNSFNPDTGMFMSAPGARPDHNIGLASDIHRIGGAPDYIGREGKWRTCTHPEEVDRICLVKGKSCPGPDAY